MLVDHAPRGQSQHNPHNSSKPDCDGIHGLTLHDWKPHMHEDLRHHKAHGSFQINQKQDLHLAAPLGCLFQNDHRKRFQLQSLTDTATYDLDQD